MAIRGFVGRGTAAFGSAPAPAAEIVRIGPTSGWKAVDFRELRQFKELAFYFVWANLKVRYKQTLLGAAWAILQPAIAMVIFSVVFGRLAGISANGVPYPIFVYAGLLPWTYVAGAVGAASNSVAGSRALITRVYFPRVLLPVSTVLTGLVDLFIAFSIVAILLAYYAIVPGIAILALPLFVAMAAATALAVSLWLSALAAEYRDIPFVVPFLIQVWLFATPVVYPSSLVPGRWQTLYGLNPMAGVVEGFRWSLLGQDTLAVPMVGVSVGVVAATLIGGLLYFRRVERAFADVV